MTSGLEFLVIEVCKKLLRELPKLSNQQFEQIREAKKKMRHALFRSMARRVCFWMVVLRVAQFAMAVAAEGFRFVTEFLSRDVVRLQTPVIIFATNNAARRVCSQSFELGLSTACFGEKFFIHLSVSVQMTMR